ncbi:hypothetical protein MIMGU_mgv1a021364mg, partial [Erythranthe guttata]
MEKTNLYYLLLLFTSCVLISAYANDEKQTKSWCIARLTADLDLMQSYINLVCTFEDCSPIKQGGACFFPDLVPNHVNYCLNVVYKRNGTCESNIGSITTIDP